MFTPINYITKIDIISYPLFVHAIRENIYGFGSYFYATCDTNPNH